MVHGFTSSGMLESQDQGFAEAAKIGSLGDKYIDNGKVLQGIFNAWFIRLLSILEMVGILSTFTILLDHFSDNIINQEDIYVCQGSFNL